MKNLITLVLLVCIFILPQRVNAKNSNHVELVKTEAPAGEYVLDKSHASLIFKVNHLGFSNYTARFKRFDAKLGFDPIDPTKSSVTASIDPTSIETDYPEPEKIDFNAELQNDKWLDIKKFSEINFTSTKIELIGNDSAKITGDFELHGIKRSVVMDAKFNGGYSGNPMDPGGARIGFSAKGKFKRSDFGIAYGIPEAGTTMGVGDDIEFIIEAEFINNKKPAEKTK